MATIWQSQELELEVKFVLSFSHFTASAQSSVTLKRNHFSFKIHDILIADLLTNWQLCIDFCRMLWKVGTGIESLVGLTALDTKWPGCRYMQTLGKEQRVTDHHEQEGRKNMPSDNKRKEKNGSQDPHFQRQGSIMRPDLRYAFRSFLMWISYLHLVLNSSDAK